MRKTTLFIAMSLDGYIADRDGGVGWLSGQGDGGEGCDPYPAFIKGIDTILMGWNTYHQIVTALSPGEWIYDGLSTYVIAHRASVSCGKIQSTAEDPATLLQRLRAQDGQGIWIMGGACVAQQLMRADLIDRYHITVIPTLLGGGIRLFAEQEKEIRLRLIETQTYDGMVSLVYERR